jgi:hypothetical protein
MTGFHEVRFPDNIAYGATGGPEFATTVVATGSGHEKRNVNWAEARGRWDVASGLKKQAQIDELIAFFRARRGKAYGFRFKDWTDYKATGQLLGTGDDAQTQFQLVKHYPSGSVIEVRTIAYWKSAMLSFVTRAAPESISDSTCSPRMALTSASTPNSAILDGNCATVASSVPAASASASPQQKSKPTSTIASLAMPAFSIARAAPAAGGPQAE